MFEELIGLETVGTVSILEFLLGLAEVTSISIIYKLIFDKFSTSVSNRSVFSFQFIPYSIAIFLIVVTIKSSLILSLGLVGALSIIRFRTAIKEPEQILSLLYLTGVAISIAANKFILPLITTLVIIIFFIIRSYLVSERSSSDRVIILKIKNLDLSVLNLTIKEFEKEISVNIELNNLQEEKNYSQVGLKVSEIDLKKIEKLKAILSKNKVQYDELILY